MAMFGFATEGCRAGSNINKTQPRVSSAELNSAGGAEEGLEKERWQEREEGESSTATFTLVTVLWQSVGRQIGKVLAVGHGTAWSGATSARSVEMAMPDCC